MTGEPSHGYVRLLNRSWMYHLILPLAMLISTAPLSSQKSEQPVLEYRIREPKVASDAAPLLLLLHGLGSNENDLLQLADHLPDDYLIVTARAPYTRSKDSYQWYEVDFSTGRPVINQAQAEQSRRLVSQFIRQLTTLHEFDRERIVVGGFSQGAVMAYQLGLSEPGLIYGVIALSGRVMEAAHPQVGATAVPGLHVLIVHGTHDGVLPVAHARKAKQYFTDRQARVTYREIEAGHTINGETLHIVNDWLLGRD